METRDGKACKPYILSKLRQLSLNYTEYACLSTEYILASMREGFNLFNIPGKKKFLPSILTILGWEIFLESQQRCTWELEFVAKKRECQVLMHGKTSDIDFCREYKVDEVLGAIMGIVGGLGDLKEMIEFSSRVFETDGEMRRLGAELRCKLKVFVRVDEEIWWAKGDVRFDWAEFRRNLDIDIQKMC
jgi:hypothetical protein